MAANDFLGNEDYDNNSDRIAAFFPNKNDAYRAMTELKQGGFSSNQIGLAALDDNLSSKHEELGTRQPEMRSDLTDHDLTHAETTGEHQSFWQEVKDFFSGESHDEVTDANDTEMSASNMGWSGDRSSYYSQGINSGGALVTVTGGNKLEARRILESCGGDLRESGFEARQTGPYAAENLQSDTTGVGSGVGTRDNLTDIGQRSIQLRGELLRAHKERVQRGDARIRKEIVTENKTIEVPVTREELVIERSQPTNANVSGEIGSDSEIRIPLSEERVVAEKHTVVNEEVKVGKREVTNMERVSDNVRHEELNVEDNLTDEGTFDINRKKPAA